MHINPREEHDVGGDDGSCGFCCSTRVSTLVEDMESATPCIVLEPCSFGMQG
jgi:hypothetical protein